MDSNNKWYVLVDLADNRATQYLQLPNYWMDMEDMWALSEEQLRTLHVWSTNATSCFMSIQEAIDAGVDQLSIDAAFEDARPLLKGWLRSMRDPLLAASDVIGMGDRWNNFDLVSQRKIAEYRQALRDITETNSGDEGWPIIPEELDFIRLIDVSNIPRPCNLFLKSLEERVPVAIEQIRKDAIERVRLERDRRKASGVRVPIDYMDFWFWTDDPSRNQYSLLEGMARRNNLPSEFVIDQWKTMSGTYVTMTVELLLRIIDLGIQREKELFTVAAQHQLAIMESSDPGSYDYSVNWPITFEEYARDNTPM